MSDPDHDGADQDRRRRTVWLLAGGAASLLLPLAGAIYMRWSETTANGPSGRGDVFERREGGKIVPSQTVVPLSAISPVVSPNPGSSLSAPPSSGRAEKPAESSLDFIKPAAELKTKTAEASKTESAPAAPAPAAAAPEPKPKAKSKPPSKPAKKTFAIPKLQPTRGFSTMKSPPGSAAPASDAGAAQDRQDLLKNLPPGAENNPEVQKYLQGQGK